METPSTRLPPCARCRKLLQALTDGRLAQVENDDAGADADADTRLSHAMRALVADLVGLVNRSASPPMVAGEALRMLRGCLKGSFRILHADFVGAPDPLLVMEPLPCAHCRHALAILSEDLVAWVANPDPEAGPDLDPKLGRALRGRVAALVALVHQFADNLVAAGEVQRLLRRRIGYGFDVLHGVRRAPTLPGIVAPRRSVPAT